jgi:hypothetical protein
MQTEWMAATTGLAEFSSARITLSRLGSWSALGLPNSRMSAPPENALPAPVRRWLSPRIRIGLCQGVGDAKTGLVTQAVDRRIVERDHRHVAVDFVFSCHAVVPREKR